jgi:hypothetical protein
MTLCGQGNPSEKFDVKGGHFIRRKALDVE